MECDVEFLAIGNRPFCLEPTRGAAEVLAGGFVRLSAAHFSALAARAGKARSGNIRGPSSLRTSLIPAAFGKRCVNGYIA